MSKQPKDLRIPIMMTRSEVEAIDDWRYASKIATRAEAMRRLCQIGLLTSREGVGLHEEAFAVLERVNAMLDPLKIIIRARHPDQIAAINELAICLVGAQKAGTDYIVRLAKILRTADIVFSPESLDGVTLQDAREQFAEYIDRGRWPDDNS